MYICQRSRPTKSVCFGKTLFLLFEIVPPTSNVFLVCRLLEQEKEEHVALKDTWEMANDRFLETQRMQKTENDKIKKLLTLEQHKQLEEELKTSPESVELLTPPSPATKKRFLSRKVQKQPVNRKEAVKTRKVNASEAKKTLSSLARGSKTNSSTPPSSILDVSCSVARYLRFILNLNFSSLNQQIMQRSYTITNQNNRLQLTNLTKYCHQTNRPSASLYIIFPNMSKALKQLNYNVSSTTSAFPTLTYCCFMQPIY